MESEADFFLLPTFMKNITIFIFSWSVIRDIMTPKVAKSIVKFFTVSNSLVTHSTKNPLFTGFAAPWSVILIGKKTQLLRCLIKPWICPFYRHLRHLKKSL